MPWVECTDPNTGAIFYYHSETGNVQWERPSEMDQPAAPEPLPPLPVQPVAPPVVAAIPVPGAGWTATLDPNSGRYYFVNPTTGVSTWNIADTYVVHEPPAPAPAPPPVVDEVWVEVIDATTKLPYYVNTTTKVTTWTRPTTGTVKQHRPPGPADSAPASPAHSQPQAAPAASPQAPISAVPQRMSLAATRPMSASMSALPISDRPTLSQELRISIHRFQLDGFANKHFAEHKKGIFRRSIPVREMLSYQSEPLLQPLLKSSQRAEKEALRCFKHIQTFMGDPNTKGSRVDPNRSGYNLLLLGFQYPELRDEIYIQLCKQVTDTPDGEMELRGWALIGLCASYFPPSRDLELHLFSSMEEFSSSQDPKISAFARYCLVRLRSRKEAKTKPPHVLEINNALDAPWNPGLFNCTVRELVDSEKAKDPQGQHDNVPSILKLLADMVDRTNGKKTQGIFRITADPDETEHLRAELVSGNLSVKVTDPHVPASLLKTWLRELAEPLIPTEYYDRCIGVSGDAHSAISLVHQLPEPNRSVLFWLIRYIQTFLRPEYEAVTMMNSLNMAVVFAPNLLRCPSSDPRDQLTNSMFEQKFANVLIDNLR